MSPGGDRRQLWIFDSRGNFATQGWDSVLPVRSGGRLYGPLPPWVNLDTRDEPGDGAGNSR
jgi:hypothetical protein